MTAGELLAKTTAAEIGEWMAYFRLEAEDAQQRELAAKARAGVRGRKAAHKRGGRR